MSVTRYGGTPVEVLIRATYRPWPSDNTRNLPLGANTIAEALARCIPAALREGAATLIDLSVEIVEEPTS